ncbi:hypothetical protein ACR6C2_42890 [Streptomyces sp. INA 01156]
MSSHTPVPRNAQIIWASEVVPSTIAASTTWPVPERCRSCRAARMPITR